MDNTLKGFLTMVVLLISTDQAQAFTDAKFLHAIAQVESGEDRNAVGLGGKARGQYQLVRDAWIDGAKELMILNMPTFSFDEWRSPVAQDAVAYGLLQAIKGRMKAKGITDPSPAQLALCWRIGFTGASALKFNPNYARASVKDYCERVSNLTAN
jgi:muramidase (phage lysozyme)